MFEKQDNYNVLREKLRKVLKAEIESENLESNEAANAKEGEMADIKFEFQIDDDWDLFEEKLSCLFITKNITDDKIKTATLVTRLHNNAHALLNQLVAPAKISEKNTKI